jgi:hypothetical protein
MLPFWALLGVAPLFADVTVTDSWEVVVAREQYEPLCEDATVKLRVTNREGTELSRYAVPLEREKFHIQSEWPVGNLPAGTYTVAIDTHGCRGIYNDNASVKTRVMPGERSKRISLAVEQVDGIFRLVHLEVTSHYSATGVLDLRFEGTRPEAVVNISNRPIVPCPIGFPDSISRDWLLDGKWGGHGYSQSYRWPDDVEIIPPGTEVPLRRGVTVIKKNSNAKIRAVLPDRQRFSFPIQADPDSSVLVDAPQELSIVPSCDTYELELPVGNDGPRLSVPMREDEEGLKSN